MLKKSQSVHFASIFKSRSFLYYLETQELHCQTYHLEIQWFSMLVLIRRGQQNIEGGSMPEYDHQPPPPQYNPQAQYGRMPATQGYMSQQPPSYGAQPAQGKQSHIICHIMSGHRRRVF